MRILTVGNMYPPHHLGGYEITWRSSVEQLRRAGHDVTVLTTDYRREGRPPDEPGVHRELRWYWRDHEYPPRGLRERVRLERHNAAVMERHIDTVRPGVVAWWAMGGMSLGLIEGVRRRGIPAIGVVGDDWMSYGPRVDAWQRLARRPLVGPALARLSGLPGQVNLSSADAWLFNSELMRQSALATGLDPAAARVAHPGVDGSRFARAPGRPWEWSVLCVGRLDPRKGLMLALDALADLPEARLRIAGGGDDRHLEELLAHAAALDVTERVTVGEASHDQVASLYAEADVVLFPVLWEEPWGLVPLEAMASGRPVVASGRGGAAEFLSHGENCLVADPSAGGAAFADAVRRLAGDPQLRARLCEGGLATAARFTETAYNERIEAALIEAAG